MSYIHLQVDLSENRNRSGIMIVKNEEEVIVRFVFARSYCVQACEEQNL